MDFVQPSTHIDIPPCVHDNHSFFVESNNRFDQTFLIIGQCEGPIIAFQLRVIVEPDAKHNMITLLGELPRLFDCGMKALLIFLRRLIS